MSNKIIIAITLVALTVLVTFTITYSFFSPNIKVYSASTVSTTTGKLILNFEDSDSTVNFENVIPSENVSSEEDAVLIKNFTVTGINTTGNDDTSSLQLKYQLSYEIVTNTFCDSDLGYILVLNQSTNGGVVNTKPGISVSNLTFINTSDQTIDLASGYFDGTENSGAIHEYTLYMFYLDTGVVQDNYDSKFEGNIVISAIK